MKNFVRSISHESWLVILIGLGVLFFGYGSYWSATWLSKWEILLIIFVWMTCFWCAKKTHWLYLPFLIYWLVSLVLISTDPLPWLPTEVRDPINMLAVGRNALYATLISIASVMGFGLLSRQSSIGCMLVASLIWATGIVAILSLPLQGILSAPNNGRMFGNPSMEASLLACLMPFVIGFLKDRLKWKHWLLRFCILGVWLITLLAIYRTKASVPWGVLGVVSAALLIAESKTKRTLLVSGITIATLAISMILVGLHALGKDFWDQNGRLEIWQMAWNWSKSHGQLLLGTGFSTTQVLVPVEQMITGHFNNAYFMWLHNDWLQLFLEGGIVGFVFFTLAFSRLVYVTWKKPVLFASFMGFVTMGLFNYPLRMPIHCFCLFLVCALAEAT